MKKVFILLLTMLVLGLSFKFGRSIYMPLVHKWKGKETVDSVKSKLTEATLQDLKKDLKRLGLDELPKKVALLGLKEEQLLEVYVECPQGLQFLKVYPFTAFSGTLGPKLKEGDRQIPEGIYEVLFLNPNSSYHLSMKINYPNTFDHEQAKKEGRSNLGDDIFIHGKAATIGCIPIGDPAIEELFLLVENALDRKVEVLISPRDFRLKTERPVLEHITWENALYDNITDRIKAFPLPEKTTISPDQKINK